MIGRPKSETNNIHFLDCLIMKVIVHSTRSSNVIWNRKGISELKPKSSLFQPHSLLSEVVQSLTDNASAYVVRGSGPGQRLQPSGFKFSSIQALDSQIHQDCGMSHREP